MQQRRTRIVATLGPSTDSPGVMEAILDNGLNVARVNFSHGKEDEHRKRVDRLRQLARERGRLVALLADLPGPKLRVTRDQELDLQVGIEVSLGVVPGVEADIPVTEPYLLAEVQPEQRLLLDDGRLQLRAVRRDGDRMVARVEVGGKLLPRKGVNLPDTRLTIPALTGHDHAALSLAASIGVDWVALSFVRHAEAAGELRAATEKLGLRVPLLAKIERPEAVENAASILEAFDGIMVARGDLGVEIPLEEVPHVQKRLIQQARAAGRPVITATDMLDSMRHNPRPTRAEVSDVANAIYDGTDAVMLSGETAAGNYPIEAFACMDRIVRRTESEQVVRPVAVPGVVEDHVTTALLMLASGIRASAIVTPTLTGRTARLIARHRPAIRIVAPTPSEAVRRQLQLVWGVETVPMPADLATGEDRIHAAVLTSFRHGCLPANSIAVVLAGHPVEGGPRLPTIRVIRVSPDGNCEALESPTL